MDDFIEHTDSYPFEVPEPTLLDNLKGELQSPPVLADSMSADIPPVPEYPLETEDAVLTSPNDNSNPTFGHSAQEIHNHKYHAELEKARAESDISHLTYMIKSKVNMGEAHSDLDSSLHDAQKRLNDAKKAISKWSNEKPDDR